MDQFLKHLEGIVDGDLVICNGIAYQKDIKTIDYDKDYFEKYVSYEDTEIARKINQGRVAIVNKYHFNKCLDIGIGSGEFIKNRPNTYGFDVNPEAVRWLKRNDLFRYDYKNFACFTFWDVIEHIPSPQNIFNELPRRSFLFTSIPLFKDLKKIRESKHYRPNEHLYYFTREGFLSWMSWYGFMFLEQQEFEIDAGREDIYTFAFQKV